MRRVARGRIEEAAPVLVLGIRRAAARHRSAHTLSNPSAPLPTSLSGERQIAGDRTVSTTKPISATRSTTASSAPAAPQYQRCRRRPLVRNAQRQCWRPPGLPDLSRRGQRHEAGLTPELSSRRSEGVRPRRPSQMPFARPCRAAALAEATASSIRPEQHRVQQGSAKQRPRPKLQDS